MPLPMHAVNRRTTEKCSRKKEPMNSPLSFSPTILLADKQLNAFRENAGWIGIEHPDNAKQDPRGRVQWAGVMKGKSRVGIARLELAAPHFCYISDLIILDRFRGQGIGYWFLKQIEEYCVDFGICRLLLQAESGTKSFYESLQFKTDPSVPGFLKKDIGALARGGRREKGSASP